MASLSHPMAIYACGTSVESIAHQNLCPILWLIDVGFVDIKLFEYRDLVQRIGLLICDLEMYKYKFK